MVQRPTFPASPHDSHCPLQAPSQQKPSAQWPLAHCASAVHAPPFVSSDGPSLASGPPSPVPPVPAAPPPVPPVVVGASPGEEPPPLPVWTAATSTPASTGVPNFVQP